MCGIAGIVSAGRADPVPRLDAMLDAIAPRGRDGRGRFVDGRCALLHTRLSIIDLEGGAQPMRSSDGRYTISFNGEVYGYRELGRRLAYDFRTESDTEVVLALYVLHGRDMLQYLNGMFAFAIWDSVGETLFCARDRFGEKPFFYSSRPDGNFVFASGVGAIAASGLVDLTLDRESVAHYLQKLYVHPAKSIYREVRPLKPGHCLWLENGQVTESRYWQLPATRHDVGFDEARERLVALLDKAVADRLVADVPVGAFLSGGLDSSTVVAAAAQSGLPLTTLSYRMRGARDEGEYARLVAERYGTRHIELHEQSLALPEMVLKMAEVYDEPFADSSNIPTYLICEQAREHCKVVLTGDGADELFGGYVAKYRTLLQMIEARDRARLVNVADLVITRLLGKFVSNASRSQKASGLRLALRSRSIADGLDRAQRFFNARDLALGGLNEPESRDGDFAPEDTLNDGFKLDLGNYMAGDILVKTDRASMANGLELRAPFLDLELAEFAISLPASFKIDRAQDKKLLRQAFESQWPEPVRRRAKQGFDAPVGAWLAAPGMVALTREYLADDRKIASVLDSRLIRAYRDSRSYKTWALLNLSIWLETRKRP